MTHHYARLVAVAIAAVSFSTPLYAQQEPTPSPTVETLVETLGGRVSGLQGTVQSIRVTNGEVVEVVLIGDQVTDASLAHLTGLTALNYLHLWDTPITDAGLPHLTGLSALRGLVLNNIPTTGSGLAHLKELPALWLLSLEYTQVADADLEHLAGLAALERLNLQGTPITNLGLAHLTGLAALERLYLYDTEVTAAGLVHLQKMPALRRLALDGPQTESPRFTDADIANLQEALPNVRIDDGSPVAPPPPPTRGRSESRYPEQLRAVGFLSLLCPPPVNLTMPSGEALY